MFSKVVIINLQSTRIETMVISMDFHRDYHRRKSCPNLQKQDRMVYDVDTVCKVVPILGIEDVDEIFKGLYVRYKKQVDSKSLREVLRLMQLRFLGSFRWDSTTVLSTSKCWISSMSEEWNCSSAGIC